MIEIDPEALVGVWEYARIKQFVASRFDGPVDVVDRDALKSHVRSAATGDAV